MGALEDFAGIEVAAGGFHYLHENAALTSEANASIGELAREMAGRFVGIDAFAGGYAMRGCAHGLCQRGRSKNHRATMVGRSVVRQDARHVIVHNDGEDDQEEDDAYLNDSFFDHEANIAAHGAFDGQQQDMAAI